MILTGRAKDDFLSWYGTGENYFTTTLKPIEQYANIVEWLDVVGYHIGIEPHIGGGADVYYAKVIYRMDNGADTWMDVENKHYSPKEMYFCNRAEATEAAIKLADKIYNNR